MDFKNLQSLRKYISGLQGVTENDFRSVQKEATKHILHNLSQHPILKRYILHLSSARRVKNTEPWQAIGEQLFRTLELLIPSSPYQFCQPLTSLDPNDPRPNVREFHLFWSALRILSSTPYLWTEEMIRISYRYPVPRHVISRDVLPFPWMFWSYETAFSTQFIDTDLQAVESEYPETNWFMVCDEGPGFQYMMDITETTEGGETVSGIIGGNYIEYGQTFPDDFPEQMRPAIGQVLGKLAFLNSPHVEITPTRAPRPIRREIAGLVGANVQKDEAICNVVTLRRAMPSSDAERLVPETEREYQHRWWVSGHIRAQWYPSLQAHKLIWIAPYIKGPEEAPFLEKVYHVSR